MIQSAPCDENVVPSYPAAPYGRSRLARIRVDGKAIYLCKHNTVGSRALYYIWALVRVVDGVEMNAEQTKAELGKFLIRRDTEMKSNALKRALQAASYVGIVLLTVFATRFLDGRYDQQLDDMRTEFNSLRLEFKRTLDDSLAPVVAAVLVKTDIEGNPVYLDNGEKLSQARAQRSFAGKIVHARVSGGGERTHAFLERTRNEQNAKGAAPD